MGNLNVIVRSERPYSYDDNNADNDGRHVPDPRSTISRTRHQTRVGRCLRGHWSADQAERTVVGSRNRPTAAANEDSQDDSDQLSVVVEEASLPAAAKRRGRRQSRGGRLRSRRSANQAAEPAVVASRNRPTAAVNEVAGRRARTATLQDVRDRSRSPILRSRPHHHQCRVGSPSGRRTGPVVVIAAEERATVAEPRPCPRRSKRTTAGQRKNRN